MKLKLELELVPSTSWLVNLRNYLTPAAWDILRRAAYKEAGYLCDICGGKGSKHPVEAHELWEYDDKKNIQTLKRLQALCPMCHSCKHFGFHSQRDPAMVPKMLKHLAKVNADTKNNMAKYVQSSFDTWRLRSQHPWHVNLDWLDTQDMKLSGDKNEKHSNIQR
jgi:hypothetical protein